MAEEKDQQQDDAEGQGLKHVFIEPDQPDDTEGQHVKFLEEGDAEGKSDEDDTKGENFKIK